MQLKNQRVFINVCHNNITYQRTKEFNGEVNWFKLIDSTYVPLSEALELERLFNDGVIQKLPELFKGIEITNT